MSQRLPKISFNQKFGILDRKIALPIILFSTAIAIFATATQIWIEYRKDVQEVGQHFEIIENSYLESLSSALWVMDPQQVKSIAEGIYSLPDVELVSIYWEDGKEFLSVGTSLKDNLLDRKFDLVFKNKQGAFPVGSIYVAMTLEKAVDRSFSRFFTIIMTNSLKSIFVCIFIFWITHQLITKHLKSISSYLDDKAPPGTLELDKKSQDDKDEIDKVADAINKMQVELEAHLNEIAAHRSALEETVKEKTLALKAAFEEKTNLLRIVCHDLANPLSIISGSVEMLSLNKLSEEKKLERIAAVERATDLMTEILRNVREMESLTSGKKFLDLASVDLGQIFANVEFVFRDRLKEKELTLNIDNQVPHNICCLADPISLGHQVLNNLVSNAIKFSFSRSTIDVKAALDGDKIHISVADHGIGMSQEHLAKIFDPHSQTTRSGTHGESGTGFGMPLVKTYVEKYGGSIEVDSVSAESDPEGHGSSFHIYLNTAG